MYYLDRLPDGYACFEVDQPSGKQVYKRLFGHPSGRFYDSIVRFETHVWWLLEGRKGLCECFLCGNFKPVPGPPRKNKFDSLELSASKSKPLIHAQRSVRQRPQISEDDSSSRSVSVGGVVTDRTRRPTRGLAVAYPVDEEGTRNIWKELLIRTHAAREDRKGIEDDVREDDSIDWLSERDAIPLYFTQVDQQHSFVPRIGELVLWCTTFPENLFLQRDPSSGQYQFYDFNAKRFIGSFPNWRGGIITAVPSRASKNGAIDFPDLLSLPEKKTALNTSGFRVETMPDPNNPDKSLSKQYRYVPLRNIRPLSHWQQLLNGIPQKQLHASILYALSCLTSISLIDKWRWNGDWKDGAYISVKGIHLGSELITVGDAVRLSPEPPSTECTDVMVVETIRLYLEGLNEDHLDLGSPRLCARSKVTLLGKAYTIRRDRAYVDPHDPYQKMAAPISPEAVKGIFRPVGTASYGSWYLLHPIKSRLEVSYDQVLGRLYEAEAICLWSGQRQQKHTKSETSLAKPDLGFDMTGIIAGRQYATKTEERIQGPSPIHTNEIRWVLSDFRAQALDIAIFNGLEVGPWFEARTPATLAAWRAHIKISKGEKVTPEELATGADSSRKKGRPSYRIEPLEELDSSPGQYSGKRRGRPPGSKIINGKMYRAEDLAKLAEIPPSSRSLPPAGGNIEIQEVENEITEEDLSKDGDIEIADSQNKHKPSSQMAGAALISSDSEDGEVDDPYLPDQPEEWTEPEDDVKPNPTSPSSKRLVAAYGGKDNEDAEVREGEAELEVGEETEETDFEEYLSTLKHRSPTTTKNTHTDTHDPSSSSSFATAAATTKRPRQPLALSKSQIMESVEHGHGSALDSVAEQEYDQTDQTDPTDEDADADGDDDLDLDDWGDVRHARGGTEESSGGDYRPSG